MWGLQGRRVIPHVKFANLLGAPSSSTNPGPAMQPPEAAVAPPPKKEPAVNVLLPPAGIAGSISGRGFKDRP